MTRTNETTVPSAAECRAFFAEQQSQQVTKDDPALAAVTSVPTTFLSKEVLYSACNLLLSDDPHDYLELTKLCTFPERITADIAAANNSVCGAIEQKFQEIRKALISPARVDWKPTRRALADQYPSYLLDRLLDVLGMVTNTAGLWSLTETEAEQIANDLDSLVINLNDCVRKLGRQLTAKAKLMKEAKDASSTTSSECGSGSPQSLEVLDLDTLPEVAEAIGRATSYLVSSVRSSLEASSSLFGSGEVGVPDPLIGAICSLHHGRENDKPLETAFDNDGQVSDLLRTTRQIMPFIQTVLALEASPPCQQLLSCPEMSSVISALQGVRSGLHEFAKQRAFEWSSMLAQSRLPHCQTPLPQDLVLLSGASENQPRFPDPPCRAELSALDGVQNFLRYKLGCLSHAMTGVYKMFGAVLGGCYEHPRVQQELLTATILGIYVSLVGFLFIDDLQDLARWLTPMLPSVRRQIKQYSAPVNVPAEPSMTVDTAAMEGDRFEKEQPPVDPVQPLTAASTDLKTTPAATTLLSLLSSPADMTLTRPAESEVILHFFMPHLKDQNVSTADQINRFLVWLAWEGDLLEFYYRVASAEAQSDTLEGPEREKLFEDAIIAAIMNGCQFVRTKLGDATDLFVVPESVPPEMQNPWSGRGQDIIELCYRAMEALSLRHVGELEIKMSHKEMQKSEQMPRWKASLLTFLTRSMMEKKQTYPKLIEGLPKFLGDFSHQTVFYRCPLPCLGQKLPDPVGVSAAVASANAGTSRLMGLAAELDNRIAGAEYLGEASILNSHDNREQLVRLEASLETLKNKFQAHVEGPSERHSNQIRIHSDLLDEHQRDIRKNTSVIANHQITLAKLTEDLKELMQGASDMRKSLKAAAKVKPTTDPSLPQMLIVTENQLKTRLDTIEAELRNLDKSLRDYQGNFRERTALTEASMKTLQSVIEDRLEACSDSALDKRIQLKAAACVEAGLAKALESIDAGCGEAAITKRVKEATAGCDAETIKARIAEVTAACSEEALTKKIEKATASCHMQTILESVQKATEITSEQALTKRIQKATEACTEANLTAMIEKATAACTEEAIAKQIQEAVAGCDETSVSRVVEDATTRYMAEMQEHLDRLNESCSSAIAKDRNSATASVDELRQTVDDIRSQLEKLEAAMKQQAQGFVDSVLFRTRRELSTYLNETLSHCVTNHILYHLQNQQQIQQKQRRRFLAWTVPSRQGAEGVSDDHPSQGPLAPPVQQPAPLVRSTHRLPRRSELDGVADSLSVMEEDTVFPEGFELTWFPNDLVFLDLPNVAAGDKSSVAKLEADKSPSPLASRNLSRVSLSSASPQSRRMADIHTINTMRMA